jgi:hypothetical protein
MKRFLTTLVLLTALCLPGFAQTGLHSYTFTTTGRDPSVNGIISLAGTGITYNNISWTTSGTVSTCAVQLDSSSNGTTWTGAGAISSQTCTSNGTSGYVSGTFSYVTINVTTLTGGGSLTVTWTGNATGGGGGGNLSGTWSTTGNVVTTDGAATAQDSGTALTALAALASPTFTGTVTIPTAAITTASGNPSFTGTPTFSNALALGSSTATSQAANTDNTTVATTLYADRAVRPVFSTAQTGISMATSGTDTVLTGSGSATSMVTPGANGRYRFVVEVSETTAGSSGTCTVGTIETNLAYASVTNSVTYAVGTTPNVYLMARTTGTLSSGMLMSSAAPAGINDYISVPIEIFAASGTAIEFQVFQSTNSNCTTAPVFAVYPALYYLGPA